MTDRTRLATGFGESQAIRSFERARRALEGMDETGRPLCPGWADPTVISLAHGEGVRRPHPSVVAAGVRALLDVEEGSLDNYLYLRSFEALDEAVRQDFLDEGIPDRYARNVVIESGNSRLFMGFFNAVAEPGDVVLVPRTYYQAVNMWTDLARLDLRVVPTEAADDYKLTPAAMDRWFDENPDLASRATVLIIFNPGYTGALYTAQEMVALAGAVERHDLMVLEDSIFTQTEFTGRSVQHLSAVPGIGDRVVTVDGGSKAYGLANIRIGWGCGSPAVVERMQHHVTATSICIPHVAKAMALAALRGPKDYLQVNVQEAMDRLDLVRSLLQEINTAVQDALGFRPAEPFFAPAHMPRAGHAVMVRAEGLAGLVGADGIELRDSVDVTRHFLRSEGVCLSPGWSNGFEDCTVRISFGCLGSEATWHDHDLQQGDATLRTVLAEIRPRPSATDLDRILLLAGVDGAGSRPLYTAGFAEGRELIREAIGNRMKRAAVKLAEQNRKLLRARVDGRRR